MESEYLKKMLSKSLCFGIYALPGSSSELAGKCLNRRITALADHPTGRHDPLQIGFARLVTDEVYNSIPDRCVCLRRTPG